MSQARLMRSETDRIFVGVCGGIAAYLGVDSAFVRIGFILLALASGVGVLLYLILMFIMPSESNIDAPSSKVVQNNFDQFGNDVGSGVKRLKKHPQGPAIAAGLLILLGVYLLMDNFQLLSWLNGTVVVALAFIAFGIYMISRRKRD
ncbi:MAG TPA: PspC domain-containing protein [candidate division Zixibacteria bacterium]|nr:PspC domain-containing protein [candidate division Zixibacteria bacterium]